MNWQDILFASILHSRPFSDPWFWVALVTVWSVAGNRALGVPLDMIRRAASDAGDARDDLEILARVQARRLHRTWRDYGVWIVGGTSAMLAGFGVTGFLYRVELAQAMFLLVFPLSLCGVLDLVTAARIGREAATGEALRKHMHRQKDRVRIIGLVTMLVALICGLRAILPSGAIGG